MSGAAMPLLDAALFPPLAGGGIPWRVGGLAAHGWRFAFFAPVADRGTGGLASSALLREGSALHRAAPPPPRRTAAAADRIGFLGGPPLMAREAAVRRRRALGADQSSPDAHSTERGG